MLQFWRSPKGCQNIRQLFSWRHPTHPMQENVGLWYWHSGNQRHIQESDTTGHLLCLCNMPFRSGCAPSLPARWHRNGRQAWLPLFGGIRHGSWCQWRNCHGEGWARMSCLCVWLLLSVYWVRIPLTGVESLMLHLFSVFTQRKLAHLGDCFSSLRLAMKKMGNSSLFLWVGLSLSQQWTCKGIFCRHSGCWRQQWVLQATVYVAGSCSWWCRIQT